MKTLSSLNHRYQNIQLILLLFICGIFMVIFSIGLNMFYFD